jgi:hypothetical protein
MVEGIRTNEQADWREREKQRAAQLKNKKVKEVSAKRAANGGFIVTHRFDNDGPGVYKEAEEHPFSAGDGGKVLDHIAQHLGLSKSKATSDDE